MKPLLRICLIILLSKGVLAQAPSGYNYDESKVPSFQLRSPLVTKDGREVTDRAAWNSQRQTLLKEFEATVYGAVPEQADIQLSGVEVEESLVWNGKAVRDLTELTYTYKDRELRLNLLSYRPVGEGPFPVFLGMNFSGNQTTTTDPAVPLSRNWVMKNPEIGMPTNVATEASRGGRSMRWPLELMVERGYAVCTLCYGDVDPDFDDGFENGLHGLVRSKEFGSIAAWAWGLREVRGYLQQLPWTDRVAVFGHSRLGKAALWAGASDPEFSLVISNNSGCGGAALSKRQVGETLKAINDRFPHWFVEAFHTYNERELELPLDQHLLMACVAPRLLYVTSASEDLWADPKGEQLATEFARPAFELLGGRVGYHMRPGRHNMLEFDWKRILDFADAHWR